MPRLGLLLFALIGVGVPTAAEAQVPGLARYFAGFRRWGGDRVYTPAPSPRPDLAIVARSSIRPLAVHGSAQVPEATTASVLAALEAAWDLIGAAGFEPPPPDGGRGGSGDFDLYLVPGGARGDDARADPEVLWSFLDSAPAYALVDPNLPPGEIAACVTSAYAQAMLIAQDPAEAIGWRRATATYLTWLITGHWGCDDGAISRQQREAHRSWVSDDPSFGDGGALFLAELAARHDGGSGRFVHDVWQIARQRTWEGHGLRGSPDLWEAIEAALEISDVDELDELVEDLAVTRYFAGPVRRGRSPEPWMRTLPADAAVPVSESFTWDELPKYSAPHEPSIEPLGSAYVEVDVAEAPVGERLRLWLRGEFGVRWSFVALSLDANGREIGRMSAPPRRLTRSYLQVDFTDRRTAKIVVIVTNLSARLPDADTPDENSRSFRVIVDKGAITP